MINEHIINNSPNFYDVWVIKAENKSILNKFKESNCVTLDWSNYSKTNKSLSIENAKNRFKSEIKINNYIISNYTNTDKFILGKVTSEYESNSLRVNNINNKSYISDLFYLKRSGSDATLKVEGNNFTILKGSLINKNESPSMKNGSPSAVRLRRKYENTFEDKGDSYLVTEDISSNSPSEAAIFVFGSPISGPKFWINKNGISYKKLKENLNIIKHNPINTSDTRSVEWIKEFNMGDLKESTQKTLNNKELVFKIDEEASKDILSLLNQENEIIEKDDIMKEKESFNTYLKNRGYLFDKKTVENYLLSLKVKPFVILTGNSGTGKTKLSQLFAEYLGEKANKEIIIEEDNDEYINIEVPITQTISKYLKEGKLFFDKRLLKRILPIDKFEGSLEVNFDGIQSNEKLYLSISGFCKDTSLKSYFKSISKDSSLKIKIKKEDINATFMKNTYLSNSQFKTTFAAGTSLLWYISKHDWNKIIPMQVKNTWDMIIDGKETKVTIKLHNIGLDATKTKNKELLEHFETVSNRNPKEKLNVTLDFSSFTSDYDEKNQDVDEEFLEQESVEIVRKVTDDRELYKIIPVGANWTENRNIVGYHNLITGKYQSTPAYNLIKEAGEDDEPYFLILDEMNLSHVERYFADFLSSIESGKPIPLYGNDKELAIPNNLFIIGTVNVDETTYMFSPKVLDRANTIEFDTCPPKTYLFEEFDNSNLEGNINYLENPLSDLDLRNKPMADIRKELSYVRVGFNKYFWTVLSEEINKFYDVLKGAGFDFGFRVIDEIVRFMYVAWKYEGEPNEFKNWQRYFDAQIKQKMLPKLHGSEKVLKKTLKELISLCCKPIEEENGDEINVIDIPVYSSSLIKLKEMEEVLKSQRYVSFIN